MLDYYVCLPWQHTRLLHLYLGLCWFWSFRSHFPVGLCTQPLSEQCLAGPGHEPSFVKSQRQFCFLLLLQNTKQVAGCYYKCIALTIWFSPLKLIFRVKESKVIWKCAITYWEEYSLLLSSLFFQILLTLERLTYTLTFLLLWAIFLLIFVAILNL